MINLFVNYYRDSNDERRIEIDSVFAKNIDNKQINTYIIESQNRLKFKDFFNTVNKVSNKIDINIIANSDIYFDETISLAERIVDNECYALCRWDVQKDGTSIFFNRSDSQDTWIFKGHIKDNVNGDFYLGYRGCDNRIAYELDKVGYKVRNVGRTIKTYHLHITGIRNYDHTNKYLVPPPYKMIEPE